MTVWKLEPLDFSSHHWRASTHTGAAIVRAADEQRTRDVATAAFLMAALCRRARATLGGFGSRRCRRVPTYGMLSRRAIQKDQTGRHRAFPDLVSPGRPSDVRLYGRGGEIATNPPSSCRAPPEGWGGGEVVAMTPDSAACRRDAVICGFRSIVNAGIGMVNTQIGHREHLAKREHFKPEASATVRG